MSSLKWPTPHRLAYLAELMRSYIGQSGWYMDLLTGEIYHPEYEAKIKPVIADWTADDKAEALALWRKEEKTLHGLGERSYPMRGQFSAIAKEVYHSSQPEFYLLGLGVSGLTFKPFAKVRLASSFVGLHVTVDLGDTLKSVSKNKRRKAIRYGKALPKGIQDRIDKLCSEAVRHYLG